MKKIDFTHFVPLVACASLAFCPQANSIQLSDATSSVRSSPKRMEAILTDPHSLKVKEQAEQTEISSDDFLLRNFSEVAIATDLEPDDVLALAILFKEANRMYLESPGSKYPIDLIIVGEGNTAIKRMRMEKLLEEHFEIPRGVSIPVVEGRATDDNIFPYDGEELFQSELLNDITYKENDGKKAAEALQDWICHSEKPFLIQIKPANELLLLDTEKTKKATILFYGSFNLRKMIRDPNIANDPRFAGRPASVQLEALCDYFSKHYSKVGILETYPLLQEQGAIFEGFEWTGKMADAIALSDSQFDHMFRNLITNWNSYITNEALRGAQNKTDRLLLSDNHPGFLQQLQKELAELEKNWDRDHFNALYNKVSSKYSEISFVLEGEEALLWRRLSHEMKLLNKASSPGVQLTLSDVLVSMAAIHGSDVFQGSSIKATFDQNAFLKPVSQPGSNIFYYDIIDRELFSNLLVEFFQ